MPDDPKPDTGKDDPKPDTGKSDTDEIEKWKALARKHEQQAKANADAAKKLQELEDRDKTESERLAGRVAEAEKRAAEAEARALRFEVAAEKGVKPRWLSGSTREELESAADEYLTDHPPSQGGGTPAPSKPKEDLRGGGDPTEGPMETDPRKLAESVPRL